MSACISYDDCYILLAYRSIANLQNIWGNRGVSCQLNFLVHVQVTYKELENTMDICLANMTRRTYQKIGTLN